MLFTRLSGDKCDRSTPSLYSDQTTKSAQDTDHSGGIVLPNIFASHRILNADFKELL
ncbi:MAG: hypothetical protein AAFQ89_22990 [Cyanobacteria bacterium J06626_18]